MSRKSITTALLKTIGTELQRRGWHGINGRRDEFTSSPNDQIRQRVFFSEPYAPRELPSSDLVGFRCAFQMAADAIENVLGQALSVETQTITYSVSLCRVCPPGTCYEHTNVHLIDPDAVQGKYSVRQLIDDYDNFLEPVRQRLSDIHVFAEDYLPPGSGIWGWGRRRAAYYHLHGSEAEKTKFLDWFEQEGEAFLAKSPMPTPGPSGKRFFTSVDELVQLNRNSEYEGVRDNKKLLAWIRSQNKCG